MRLGGISLVAALGVAGVVAFGPADGHPARNVKLLSGAAWLPSAKVGQLTLLDGASVEVAAQVQVANPGNLLDVVQQGSTAYAIDRTSGTLRRVDGATFDLTPPATPIPDAHGGLTAFPTSDAIYTVDNQRGVMATLDPATLAPRGDLVSLSTRLSSGAAAMDGGGKVWLLDSGTGDVTRLQGRITGRATEQGQSLLTMAGGQPVVVNIGNRTVSTIDPATAKPRATITLDLRPGDTIQASGSPNSSRVYVAASRGLLTICELAAGKCDDVVPLASGSDLGAPIESGNRLFIPDYLSGRVWIVDLTSRKIVANSQVLSPPGKFQLLTRDGVVFFNDPDTERAGVIKLNGEVTKTAKYDVKDPNKGLQSPDKAPNPPPTQTPQPQPNQPAPNDPPPNNPPPNNPPPNNPPPNNPPPANPPPVDPPPNDPPPVVEPATLQITLSKANPVVNEDISLQVKSTKGIVPTSAAWDYGDGQQGTGATATHRWTTAKTYNVSVQATMPDGQHATTSVSLTVSPPAAPPAPVHLSPRNGIILTDFPRTATLTWRAVPGAARYDVEVECLHCAVVGQWNPVANATVTQPNHTFTFPGDNDGRWRVTAIATNGTRGATSVFWTFKFFTGTIDLFQEAPNAVWRSGAGTLPFNGNDGDPKGFVQKRDAPTSGCTLEDGSSQPYLETHPEMKPGGFIDGTYTLIGAISSGQHFKASLGYLKCGATNVGIDIFVVQAIMPNGTVREILRTTQTGTDNTMHAVDVDLTPFAGATKLRLRVEDGEPNGQDWACWVGAKIDHGNA
jgi:hypothetical protein